MKRRVMPIPMEPTAPDQMAKAVLSIQKPGLVCDTLLAVKKKEVLVAGPGDTVGQGLEFIPTILVAVDPDEQTEERTFYLIPPGEVLDIEQDLEYRGRFLYPNGRVLLLFEETDAMKNAIRELVNVL